MIMFSTQYAAILFHGGASTLGLISSNDAVEIAWNKVRVDIPFSKSWWRT
jgi:hypothetical protein